MHTLGFFIGEQLILFAFFEGIMKKIFVIFVISLLIFLSADKTLAKELASGSSAKIEFTKESKASDARVKVLQDYLNQYNSPLVPLAPVFVKYADQYDLDWKMVAAISGVESTFGQQIPYGSYNGWGWGIYGTNMIYFSSWEDGIKTVSQGLRENYLNKWGATNVYEIGRFYAASPTWAQRVDYFMGKISDFALRNPQSALPLSI